MTKYRLQCSKLAGVPIWVFQNYPFSQSYCFKSCLVARHGHRWKQMTVLEPVPLVTWYRDWCWQKWQEGVAEAGNMGSFHSLGSEKWILLFGMAPYWGTSSAVVIARNICLYPRKPTGCSCILLTSTERHGLLLGILVLVYTQLPTFVLIKPLLNLLTPILVQI